MTRCRRGRACYFKQRPTSASPREAARAALASWTLPGMSRPSGRSRRRPSRPSALRRPTLSCHTRARPGDSFPSPPRPSCFRARGQASEAWRSLPAPRPGGAPAGPAARSPARTAHPAPRAVTAPCALRGALTAPGPRGARLGAQRDARAQGAREEAREAAGTGPRVSAGVHPDPRRRAG